MVFTFSHVKAYVSKIDVAVKKGQGHPKVIICVNYDGLESPMLHTKFMEISTLVLEKKIFERFLPYKGVAAILVM